MVSSSQTNPFPDYFILRYYTVYVYHGYLARDSSHINLRGTIIKLYLPGTIWNSFWTRRHACRKYTPLKTLIKLAVELLSARSLLFSMFCCFFFFENYTPWLKQYVIIYALFSRHLSSDSPSGCSRIVKLSTPYVRVKSLYICSTCYITSPVSQTFKYMFNVLHPRWIVESTFIPVCYSTAVIRFICTQFTFTEQLKLIFWFYRH